MDYTQSLTSQLAWLSLWTGFSDLCIMETIVRVRHTNMVFTPHIKGVLREFNAIPLSLSGTTKVRESIRDCGIALKSN